jgi:hypothetical protein
MKYRLIARGLLDWGLLDWGLRAAPVRDRFIRTVALPFRRDPTVLHIERRCSRRNSAGEGSRKWDSRPTLGGDTDARGAERMPDTTILDPTALKFGIGQPVPRQEDPTLLQGRGRYTDDIDLPGQLYCAIVRSPYAHGVILGIDTAPAREVPGVSARGPAPTSRRRASAPCPAPCR